MEWQHGMDGRMDPGWDDEPLTPLVAICYLYCATAGELLPSKEWDQANYPAGNVRSMRHYFQSGPSAAITCYLAYMGFVGGEQHTSSSLIHSSSLIPSVHPA